MDKSCANCSLWNTMACPLRYTDTRRDESRSYLKAPIGSSCTRWAEQIKAKSGQSLRVSEKNLCKNQKNGNSTRFLRNYIYE